MAEHRSFFNEFDPFMAEWLGNLVNGGVISDGDVSPASIIDLKSSDLTGYDRVHLFAGLGGWDYAMRLAGWPRWLPAMSGSAPCQPFSVIGKQKGTADERHLWPEMFRLIQELHNDQGAFPVVFGEQVASKPGLEWIDGVLSDLEAAGYTGWATDLAAAGAGADHRRQRLYWVACAMEHPIFQRLEGHTRNGHRGHESGRLTENEGRPAPTTSLPHDRGMGDAHCEQGGTLQSRPPMSGERCDPVSGAEPSGRSTDQRGLCSEPEVDGGPKGQRTTSVQTRRDPEGEPLGCGWRPLVFDGGEDARHDATTWQELTQRFQLRWIDGVIHARDRGWAGWDDHRLVVCRHVDRDGSRSLRFRRVSNEPGAFPLAHGVPTGLRSAQSGLESLGLRPAVARRMLRQPSGVLQQARRNHNGRIKGYGNAICPQLAAIFLTSWLESMGIEPEYVCVPASTEILTGIHK